MVRRKAARGKDAVHRFDGESEQVGKLHEVAAEGVSRFRYAGRLRGLEGLKIIAKCAETTRNGKPRDLEQSEATDGAIDIASSAELVRPAGEIWLANGLGHLGRDGSRITRHPGIEAVEE